MEERLDDLLFWYKCAMFCFACRYVQENYSVCSCFPSLSDLMHDLHQMIMIGVNRGVSPDSILAFMEALDT